MTTQAPHSWLSYLCAYIIALCTGITIAVLWPNPSDTITVPRDTWETVQRERHYYFEKANDLEDEIKDLNWEISQRPAPTDPK